MNSFEAQQPIPKPAEKPKNQGNLNDWAASIEQEGEDARGLAESREAALMQVVLNTL